MSFDPSRRVDGPQSAAKSVARKSVISDFQEGDGDSLRPGHFAAFRGLTTARERRSRDNPRNAERVEQGPGFASRRTSAESEEHRNAPGPLRARKTVHGRRTGGFERPAAFIASGSRHDLSRGSYIQEQLTRNALPPQAHRMASKTIPRRTNPLDSLARRPASSTFPLLAKSSEQRIPHFFMADAERMSRLQRQHAMERDPDADAIPRMRARMNTSTTAMAAGHKTSVSLLSTLANPDRFGAQVVGSRMVRMSELVESESESDGEERAGPAGAPRFAPEGRLASKKVQWCPNQRVSLFLCEDSSSSESESASESGSESPTDDERTTERAQTPEDLEEEEEGPQEEIVAALESLSLALLRMRATGSLPLLLRCLRRGFAHRCTLVRVSTTCSPPRGVVKVVYRRGDAYKYVGRMISWKCPVCELHGVFANRDMLRKHMEWDHEEVEVLWEEMVEGWKLTLNLPDPDDDLEPEIPSFVHTEVRHDPGSGPAPESTRAASPSITETPGPPEVKFRPQSPASTTSARPTSTTTASRSSFTPTTQRTTPIWHDLKEHARDEVDAPTPFAGFGPTARYPYLPEEYYSCRPGGPRLYDLVNLEPMEPFGVLGWAVEERDEEIFELDDCRDEDKVIQALWSRWSFLHRAEFIRNYYNGTIKFVDAYWTRIREAAGWGALRVLVLVLVANRFLTSSEAANVMRHYEALAGVARYAGD